MANGSNLYRILAVQIINNMANKSPSKPLVTKSETSNGRNLKSVNKVTKLVTINEILIKNPPQGYHVSHTEAGTPYLRSNPDHKKKNNLDPKRKP